MQVSDNIIWIAFSEIIFALITCNILLLLVFYKVRKHNQTLLAKCRELYQQQLSVSAPKGNDPTPITNGSAVESSQDFLTRSCQHTLLRFQKIMPQQPLQLAADMPFNAKVAALRHSYLSAELEHYQLHPANENWLLLEKKLADIVSWIANPQADAERSIEALEQKIAQLEPLASAADELKEKLKRSGDNLAKLEAYKRDSQASMKKMQRIINALELANSYKGDGIGKHVSQLLTSNSDPQLADAAYQASTLQLDTISDIAGQKKQLVKAMNQQIAYLTKDLSPEQRKKMEETIRILEMDLLRSDHHITNLQKELQATRQEMQQANGISAHHSTQPVPPVQAGPAAGTDILHIIHNTEIPGIETQEPDPTWSTLAGQNRTMEEINSLRDNNHSQRQIIIELNRELQSLYTSMDEASSEGEKEAHSKDIVRLERLVKECEGCIEILESEVERLYQQLRDNAKHNSSTPNLAEANSPAPEQFDAQQLNEEIEAISAKLQQTISQFSETKLINEFCLNMAETHDLEAVGKQLIDMIKKLALSAGFYIQSTIGNMTYFSDSQSTPSEQKVLKSSEHSQPITHNSDGILFFRANARLILRNPPAADEQQLAIEKTLDTLIAATNAHIKNLEAKAFQQEYEKKMNGFVEEIKKHLRSIGIQYNYQAQESRTIVQDMIKELKSSSSLLNASAAAKLVFDNIINESNKRLDMVSELGQRIGANSTKLTKKLENPRPPQH